MAPHSITLESPWNRIQLVPLSSTNDEAYAYCRTHPVTRKYLGMIPGTMTTEEAHLYRTKRTEETDRLDFDIIFKQKDGSTTFGGAVGYFKIDNRNLSCETGIAIHPDLHRKHIATEVFYVLLQHIFEDRKIHRVVMETSVDNVNMRGWLENVAGARSEGEFKDVWRDEKGDFMDGKAYAILEGEWLDTIKKRLKSRLDAAL